MERRGLRTDRYRIDVYKRQAHRIRDGVPARLVEPLHTWQGRVRGIQKEFLQIRRIRAVSYTHLVYLKKVSIFAARIRENNNIKQDLSIIHI